MTRAIHAAVVVGLIVPLLAGGLLAGELFHGPVYPTSREPWDSVVADFNADGHLDAAVGAYGGGYVTILLGRGDGSFAHGEIPILFPTGLDVGDFDEDGHLDLVVVADTYPQLWVFYGLGDGTFGEGQPVLLEGVQGALFAGVGDLNEDGHEDIVATFWVGGNALVFGNGDGTFGRPTINPGFPLGWGTKVLDIDGDGHLDYVVAYPSIASNGDMYFLYGAGDGTFPRSRWVQVGEYPLSFAAGDLDGDGDPDFAVPNLNSDDVSVLINTGGGSFAPEQRYPVVSQHPSGGPWAVALADIDGDQDLDLIVSDQGNLHVSLFPGNGDGTFALERVAPAPLGGGAIVAGHFDDDSRPDLLVASRCCGSAFLLRGRGDGTFSFRGRDDFAAGEEPTAMVQGDFDLDGAVDLAVANTDSDDVALFLGDGIGGLQGPSFVPVGADPAALATGRIDTDEHPDLLVVNGGSNDGSVLLGLGDGTFNEIRVALVESPHAVALGHLDDDLVTDLAVLGSVPADVVTVLSGVGDGTFGPAGTVSVGTDPAFVTISDLDRDGAQDLIVANRGSQDLSVVFGHGDGSFADQVRIPLGDVPGFVAVADLDDDLNLDLAVAIDSYPYKIVVLHGAGAGALEPPVEISLDAWSSTIAAGDLDGDSTMDLAVSSARRTAVAVLTGHGDGSFREPEYYSTNGWGVGVVIDDFDGDDRNDLAVATRYDSVTLLLNQAGPASLAFVSNQTLEWPPNVIAVSYAVYRGLLSDLNDANGDGAADDGYGACLDDPAPPNNHLLDPEVPEVGAGFFYLVGAVFGDGAESLGTTTSGLTRTPTAPCGAR